MSMLSQLMDPSKVASLSESQVSALNQHLELSTALAVLGNNQLKTQLSQEVTAAAANLK
jgi:hypothetical protein